MAGTIGPSSYLPGDCIRKYVNRDGMLCDNEACDELAEFCVVGETDSFGSETSHFCRNHFMQFNAEMRESRNALELCDMCDTEKPSVTHRRDPSEGMCGPVYLMCPGCYKRIMEAFIGDDEGY